MSQLPPHIGAPAGSGDSGVGPSFLPDGKTLRQGPQPRALEELESSISLWPHQSVTAQEPLLCAPEGGNIATSEPYYQPQVLSFDQTSSLLGLPPKR